MSRIEDLRQSTREPQATDAESPSFDRDPFLFRAHFALDQVREAEGRIAEAIGEYQRAGVLTAGAGVARRALQQGGPHGCHRWALIAGIARMPRGGSLDERPFFRARLHARRGEADETIRCLEEFYAQRECLLVLLKAQEWWDPLRSDPRFANLVQRVGIP